MNTSPHTMNTGDNSSATLPKKRRSPRATYESLVAYKRYADKKIMELEQKLKRFEERERMENRLFQQEIAEIAKICDKSANRAEARMRRNNEWPIPDEWERVKEDAI